jgi:hypothetical protein
MNASNAGWNGARRSGALLLLLLSSIFCARVSAQTQGSIAGTITDATKSVVSHVKATATSNATGTTVTVESNGAGIYRFPFLAPGMYTVSFVHDGFKLIAVQATVVVSETTPVDVTLPLGSVAEQVTINETNTALLETDSSALGRVVDQKQVQDLPLATRNFTQLMTLSPGTSSAVNDATQAGRDTIDVFDNGARADSNSLTIDGIDADDIHSNNLSQNSLGTNGVSIPSPEAIQEFKVQTGLYDAEYGRNGGANTSLVTRSGGSQYHGSVYEYVRNTDMDANNYFTRVAGQGRPPLKQNQFGAVAGGPMPLVKDTFFFASYQGTRQIDGVGSTSITNLTLPAGLYNSTRTAAALGAYYAGQKGIAAGSTLTVASNGSNISPVALAYLNYQLPNGTYIIPSPQTMATANNYTMSINSTFKEDGWILNLDHNFGSKNIFSVKGLLMNDPQFNPFPNANIPGFGQTQDFKSRAFNFADIHSFSDHLVNEAHAGFFRIMGALSSQTDLPISTLGMSRYNSSIFNNVPKLNIAGSTGAFNTGYSADGNEAGNQNTFQYTDIVALTKGKHSLRIGVELRRYQDNFYDYNYTLGVGTVYSFVDFLLGRPAGPTASGGNGSTTNGALSASAISSTNALRNDRLTDYMAFLQDDFKMTSKITWNLGLRWERFGMGVDRGGRNGNFVPALYSPPPSGGSTTAGFVQSSNSPNPLPGIPLVKPTFLNHEQWKNFAPRIGVAYALTPKIALHGGYGIFFDRLSNQISSRLALAPPNYIKSSLTASGAETFSLANPFVTLPLPSALPVAPLLYDPFTYPATTLLASDGVDPNMGTPYFQQYMTNVEWQAESDLLLEIGYVGTKGVKLPGQQLINQAQIASTTAPVNGVTTTTTAAANIDERVPFLGMSPSGLTYLLANEDSRYNSLQVSATKSLRHGLQFLVSYTLSKSIDDASGGDSVFNTVSGDQTNVHQATGPSDFDRPNRFVMSGLYELPYPHRNGWTHQALGGWQFGWITVLQSGTPFNITDSNGAAYYGTGTSRASYAAGATNATAKKTGPAIARLTGYFNTAAYVTAGNYFGNVPRNSLRGPGQANWDMSLHKSFELPEKIKFELRAEYFNVFNHTNFANPSSAVSTGSTFGVISSTVGNPRILQLAGRLSF